MEVKDCLGAKKKKVEIHVQGFFVLFFVKGRTQNFHLFAF